MKILIPLIIVIVLFIILYNLNQNKIIDNKNNLYKNHNVNKRDFLNINYDEDNNLSTLPNVKRLNNNKKDVDLLIQNEFNLHKMNLNRWNYGNKDFAPYIDGSFKQNTNNYVPGFKFNKDEKLINEKKGIKINAWKNKNETDFFVQCS